MLVLPFLLVIGAALLGFWAQNQVVRNYKRYLQIPNRAAMTGAEVAAAILRRARIDDVTIEKLPGGPLRDHYDPKKRVLRLTEEVHDGRSVAAMGVAAHEAGHALQDAMAYAPLTVRSLAIPSAQLGNAIGLPLLLFGAILHIPLLAILGALFYLGVILLQLITLPVELDASKRALENLDELRLLQTEEEAHGAAAVLNAAALTYVAAALAGIAMLLYYLFMIFGGRRN
ncbi:MAG: zinc metallopeptidase [Planctomycetes bacterium]|nr:zinc metallopeptidase [Planctomycetota bacterium]MCP4772293.1 zinc metallopeptidase [Planctomycetota bacterium]MCP4861607.1 zinc metallopeptidase [Planctomycetota bacterium]